MDIRYDLENEAVYASLGPIQEADDSKMLPNDTAVQYKDGKPIGCLRSEPRTRLLRTNSSIIRGPKNSVMAQEIIILGICRTGKRSRRIAR